jgi:hypothetical protein
MAKNNRIIGLHVYQNFALCRFIFYPIKCKRHIVSICRAQVDFKYQLQRPCNDTLAYF